MRRLKTVRRPPIYPESPGHLPCSSLTHPLPLPSRRPSVSFGGFGLSMSRNVWWSLAISTTDDDIINVTQSTGGNTVPAPTATSTMTVIAWRS